MVILESFGVPYAVVLATTDPNPTYSESMAIFPTTTATIEPGICPLKKIW